MHYFLIINQYIKIYQDYIYNISSVHFIYQHSGVTTSFFYQIYIYPDIGITFFVITHTNYVIYQDANCQFVNNLENLIDSSSLFLPS